MIIGFHSNAVHTKYFLFVMTKDEHNLLLVFLHLCTAIKNESHYAHIRVHGSVILDFIITEKIKQTRRTKVVYYAYLDILTSRKTRHAWKIQKVNYSRILQHASKLANSTYSMILIYLSSNFSAYTIMGFLCKGQFFAFAHNILNIALLSNVLSFSIPNISTGIHNAYFL